MKLSFLLVLLAFPALAGCASLPAGPAGQADPREVRELFQGWQFRFDNAWDPERAKAAPASFWQPVSLPHSWNRLGEYRLERSAATDDRQGKGWYRLTIDGRSLDPAKKHFIEFDGVGNVADAWLNGRHLGRHAGAFSRFRFELSGTLNFQGENLLVVRADNSKPEPGSTTEHVVPLLGDFFIHGGIYRPARLVSVSPSHISLTDFGGPGVFMDTELKGDGSAVVSVRVKLTDARPGQLIEVALHHADGRIAAVGRRPIAASVQDSEARVVLSALAPRLWDGRRDPYLYRLVATLSEEGRALDRVEQRVGIRTIRFDPERGFFLNGRHTPLYGVSRHQDVLGQGWALTRADHERDMALIAEMGANTIRFAHYQHAEDWFELADRSGMAVWAEIPFVNKVSFGDREASPELVANARQQLIELIRQNYNSPSVITWGIGNEVDIDLAFGRLGPRADARPLLRELNALSHAEDRSRPTVIADCCEATPGEKVDYLPTLTGEADLMGYNRYFGWYYGKVGDLGPHLDALHAKYPKVPLSVSEYGAGGALSQHVDDPTTHKINAGGRPHPEEYQSWIHEQSWPQLRARRYLWATWIWNMFDFSSRRKEGDAVDINDKGLVTFDRKVKKDAFFYYKAQWSGEPVVHITSRRFVERTAADTSIKVYSNASRIALGLNGKPMGDVACADRVCLLPNVRLVPGANVVEANAAFPSGTVRDRVEWRLVTPPAPASRR
ncbi:MAG TPA: glycoside hydrolase family 2 TIM barrel-domain containing protein [Sphingomicrobium sp.]|nr:glycoside hydrolase family 2 TIM barrel-domain containing protein [Sphingomicrobium sp.]